MLKRIALSDLELGMFVHKMEGNWFEHPFWKGRFMIETQDKLRTLKSSGLEEVVIDTSKGKDITRQPAQRSTPKDSGRPSPKIRINGIKSRRSVVPKPIVPASTEKELHAAQKIAEKAKDNMRQAFLAARLGKALNVRAVEPVVKDILGSVRRNPQAFAGLMRCKLQNELIFRHALAVSALMVSLGRQMKLCEKAVYEAGLAGLFLDIGTNYLPKDLNPRGGDYRNADPKIWQQHVTLGHRVLQNDDSLPEAVLDACLHHHERIDGTGFPNGLAQEDIGQVGRMAAICDTFDYMLTQTDATEALDPALAIQKLLAIEGAFDTDILRLFIESVGLYPVGSFVRLRSDKLAMVIDEDPKESAKPVVQAFYSFASADRIVPHRVELARRKTEDEIVGIADLSGLNLPEDGQLRELIFLSAHKLSDNTLVVHKAC